MSDRNEPPQPLRVPDELLDYDEELTYTYNGERFTGIGFTDVPGHGLSEISYRGGFQSGIARDWYPSGRLSYEADYKQNVRHGNTRQFREDGSLELEATYDNGVLVRSTKLDADGEVVEHYEIPDRSSQSVQLQRLHEQEG